MTTASPSNPEPRTPRAAGEDTSAYLEYLYVVWTDALDAAVAARGGGPEALLGVFDAMEVLCGTDGTRRASFVHILAELGPTDPLGRRSIDFSARLRDHIAGLAEAAGIARPAEFAADCQLLLDGTILSAAQGSSRAAKDARALARSLIKFHLAGPKGAEVRIGGLESSSLPGPSAAPGGTAHTGTGSTDAWGTD